MQFAEFIRLKKRRVSFLPPVIGQIRPFRVKRENILRHIAMKFVKFLNSIVGG